MYHVRLFFFLLISFAALSGNGGATATIPHASTAAAQPATADFFSWFRAVRVVGNRAYVAAATGLLLYNVSDRANPRQLSQLFLAPSGSYQLEVSGNYVYLLSGKVLFEKPFLRVIEVSDPLAPRLVAEYTDLVEQQVFDLHIAGTTLAIANQSSIDLLDISDPPHPRRVGRFEVSARTGNFRSLASRNSTLFAAYDGPLIPGQGGGVILAIDISNPSAPVRIGDLALDRKPHSIAITTETLYIGCDIGIALDGFRVFVVDASDPSRLVRGKEFQLPTPPEYGYDPTVGPAVVVAKGNRLIAAVSRASKSLVRIEVPFPIEVFDISDPREPRLLKQTQLRCEVEGMDIDVAQSDVFMPAWDAHGIGMAILNLMPDGGLTPISNVLVPTFLDVEVASGTTFLVGANALYAVKPGGGGRAEVVGKVLFPEGAVRLQVVGTRAYVFTEDDNNGTNSHIHIVDVADPANMRELGSILVMEVPLGNWIITSKRFFVEGYTLYVASPDGLSIYDASEPTQLRRIGFFQVSGTTENVLVKDGIAYVIAHRPKKFIRRIDLYVVNMRKPSKPKLMGRLRNIEIADFVTDMATQEDRLYLLFTGGGDGTLYWTIGGGRLAVVNLGEPSAPRLEAKMQTRPDGRGYASGIYVAGDRAYVADGLDGVSVFSLKRDATPELLRTLDTPGFANGVWVDAAGNIAVADDYSYLVYTASP